MEAVHRLGVIFALARSDTACTRSGSGRSVKAASAAVSAEPGIAQGSVDAEQAADEGYEVHRDRLLRGRTPYEIVTLGGVRLLVTVLRSGRLVDIDSCSSFPNDYEPLEVY